MNETQKHAPRERIRSLLIPLIIALLCALMQLAPGMLQYEREAVASAVWWRIVTGNFVHFGWGHYAGDISAFLVLCLIARHRTRDVLVVVGASAVAVGVGVHFAAPDVMVYRGISGVYYGLMTFNLIAFVRRDRGAKRILWSVMLAALLFKTAYELATGTLLVQTCLPAGVAVVGMSHLAGIVAGAGIAGAFALSLPSPEGGGVKKQQRLRPSAPCPAERLPEVR